MSSLNSLIVAEGLGVSLGKRPIISDLSLTVGREDVLVVVGPSGCGKTTLLKTLDLLVIPDTGVLSFDGERVFAASGVRTATASRWLAGRVFQGTSADNSMRLAKNLHRYRLNFGVVFQEYNLWPHLTLEQNIGAPLSWRGGVSKRTIRSQVLEVAEEVQIRGLLERYPYEVSGGERQRAALARALVVQPRVLLLDEVTGALDPELVADMLSLIMRLRDAGHTMVVVTHHIRFAQRLGTRAVFMHSGRILEQGDANSFFANPATQELREFLGHFRDL